MSTRPVVDAIDAASRGQWATARRLARGHADALPAAIVLFFTRDYHDAFVELARAEGGRADWLTYERAVRIGWDRRAVPAVITGVAREPDAPHWRAAALALHARAGEDEVALEHGHALLALRPTAVSAIVELAWLHARRGERDEARALVARARAATPSPIVLEETERILCVVPDEVEAAERVLRRVFVRSVGEVDAALSALGTAAGERARDTLRAWRDGPATLLPGEEHLAAARYSDAVRLLWPLARDGHVAAWLNLVLAYGHAGDERRARAAAERAEIVAPALVSDAARGCATELHGDGGAEPTLDALVAVFERARASLRGNRSASCTTYVSPEGELCTSRPLSHRDREERDLAEARRSVRPGAVQRSLPTPLGPADLEHFIEHGFVRIEGAVPRARIEEWRATASRELSASARAGTLRFTARRAASDLSNLDLDEPGTWPSGTLVYPGSRTLSLLEFAPVMYGAIAQLLGGVERLATREISDYLIIRFPDDDATYDLSWHLDDPGPAMSLSNLRNGLVALILFSDVLPDGGATFLAPDSLGHVVRSLAGSPEGVDFTTARIGEELSARTTTRVACAGGPGDVYLAHPLLLHSASPNLQRSLRWLANLMIHVNEPLRPDGGSPVELAIGRALYSAASEPGRTTGSITE